MTDDRQRLHLFDAFGVELEYMIVDADSLNVLPITDRLLERVAGAIVSDVERGDIAWSNELVLHVVEIKTNGPARELAPLAAKFQDNVQQINRELQPLNARLMPGAMHPWMDPYLEMQLWPHDYSPVYEAFDRIFDCRGHGWANLQSMHINLPFADDEEFGRLHAAIRVLLPILPGLAASSPAMDGRLTGLMDNRLEVYRTNSRRIPSIAGRVIPERAFTAADYERLIFSPMFADIAPHDPEGVLRDEFLNARGAIARFSRGAIEIRVLDVQECPAADLAIAQTVAAVLQSLASERWSSLQRLQSMDVEPLHQLLLMCIQQGEEAQICDREFLDLFGWTKTSSATVNQLWRYLVDATQPCRTGSNTSRALEIILGEGPLARRITRRLKSASDRESLFRVYAELCDCLSQGLPLTVS